MKANFLLLMGALTLSMSTAFTSCKKDDGTTGPGEDPACTGCESTSAQAVDDSAQTGVYKGLLLTGTGLGHFRLNMQNDGGGIIMVMKYTRDTYPVLNDSLRPQGSVTITPNSDVNATIIGSASRTTIYTSAIGNNPSVGDFTLSGGIGTGPKPQACVLKEYSNAQVKVFEGTMQETSASSPNGKVGFVVRGNKIQGIITSASNALREGFSGTIGADKTFSFSFSGNNSVYSGSFTSDTEISGQFTINGTAAGTFTASRAF